MHLVHFASIQSLQTSLAKMVKENRTSSSGKEILNQRRKEITADRRHLQIPPSTAGGCDPLGRRPVHLHLRALRRNLRIRRSHSLRHSITIERCVTPKFPVIIPPGESSFSRPKIRYDLKQKRKYAKIRSREFFDFFFNLEEG